MARFMKLTFFCAVTFLTLLTACSAHKTTISNDCNSRAYIKTDIAAYLSSRFDSKAPVRLAIVPFGVPANLSGWGAESRGLGFQIGMALQGKMLETELAPISELFERRLANQKLEFFKGNHEVIDVARQANFDLVLVGLMDELRSNNTISAYSKLIDTSSGITLWYGRTTSRVSETGHEFNLRKLNVFDRVDYTHDWGRMVEELTSCIAHDMTFEEFEPEESARAALGTTIEFTGQPGASQ